MEFQRTENSLKELHSYGTEQIGMYEILSVFLDIMNDVKDICDINFAELPMREEAVQQWAAVTRSLLRIPLETGLENASEKKKARMESLQKEISEKLEENQAVEQATQEITQQIVNLEKQLEAQKAQKTKLQEKIQYYNTLREQIQRMDTIDDAAINEQLRQLEQIKAAKQKSLQNWDTLQNQLAEAEQENIVLRQKITDISSQIQSVSQEIQNKTNEKVQLEEKHNSLLAECGSKDFYINRITKDIAKAEEGLAEKQSIIDARQETLNQYRIKNGEMAFTIQQTEDDVKAEQVSCQQHEDELKDYEKQYDILQEQIQAISEEIENCQNRIASEVERQQQLQSKDREQKIKLEGLVQQGDAMQEELLECETEISNKEMELENNRQELIKQRNDSLALDAEQQSIAQSIRVTKEKYFAARKETEELQAQKEKWENDLQSQKQEIENYKADLQSEEYYKLQDQVSHYRSIIKIYKDEIENLFALSNLPHSVLQKKIQEDVQNLNDEIASIHEKLNQLDMHYADTILKLDEALNQYSTPESANPSTI